MKLSNKAYDATKFVAQVGLPAAATLYFALAQIWHLPSAEEIVGTATAVDTFLGVLLGISSSSYKPEEPQIAGTIDILPNADSTRTTYSLNVNGAVEDVIDNQSSVTFLVNRPNG